MITGNTQAAYYAHAAPYYPAHAGTACDRLGQALGGTSVALLDHLRNGPQSRRSDGLRRRQVRLRCWRRRRGVRDGHVFNAVNQRGVIRFLDGQVGGSANLDDGFVRFWVTYTSMG
ncbi:toxin glutamine deamidase domain-containing protein [Rhizocola hellebori]|uniref:toxin glutamine deamidase domain-containing protein n=1 Tax=Rhizocola hellebori TaxID=1392758 RepID=UPI0019455AB2